MTPLVTVRELLAGATEREIVPKYGEFGVPKRVVLPEGVEQRDLADLLFHVDALITSVERDFIATDRAAATLQVCAMTDQTVRDLLVDLLAKPRGAA